MLGLWSLVLCLRVKLHGISLEVLGCLKLSIGTFCHRQGLFGVLSTKPPMPQPRMHSSTFVQVKPSLLCLYCSKSGEKASSTLVPPGQTSPLTSLSLIFLCYRMCRRNQSHWTQGCCENLKNCVNTSTNEKWSWVDYNLLLVTDPYFLTKPTVGPCLQCES